MVRQAREVVTATTSTTLASVSWAMPVRASRNDSRSCSSLHSLHTSSSWSTTRAVRRRPPVLALASRSSRSPSEGIIWAAPSALMAGSASAPTPAA